jgi:hypothetical protein
MPDVADVGGAHAGLVERPQGWVVQPIRERRFEVVEDERANQALHAQLAHLNRGRMFYRITTTALDAIDRTSSSV